MCSYIQKEFNIAELKFCKTIWLWLSARTQIINNRDVKMERDNMLSTKIGYLINLKIKIINLNKEHRTVFFVFYYKRLVLNKVIKIIN